ncbi:hypothetical protein [uncultured Brevibacillus sp.]|uniref:hypothetical protein n=1 Tax=uncultured Brevibacillus sp. TaxID=169970 RepID=UPI002594D3D6|nr:hypothetical protein [uncultured Brevibacillus sp.]
MARNPEKQRCKARSKQRGEQCKNWAKPGWDVCRFHGAGGGAPPRNSNAVKTGEHQSIWMDALSPEQQDVIARVSVEPMEQINQSITLYAWREREIMLKISALESGLTEKQRRVLQKRQAVKGAVPVPDKDGQQKTITVSREELVIAELEETEYRAIDDILHLQEALTRVTDRKLRAVEMKHKLIIDDDDEDEGDGLESLAKAIEESRNLLEGEE